MSLSRWDQRCDSDLVTGLNRDTRLVGYRKIPAGQGAKLPRYGREGAVEVRPFPAKTRLRASEVEGLSGEAVKGNPPTTVILRVDESKSSPSNKRRPDRTECNTHTLVAHVAALHHSSALLVKYRVGPDSQDGWFLPNDDLHRLEHPEQAARRILKEQAGVDDSTLKLVEIESFMGNNETWHLIFDYLAFTRTMNVSPGKGVAELRWFEIDKLPPAEDFAHHGWGRAVLVKHALGKAQPLTTSSPR